MEKVTSSVGTDSHHFNGLRARAHTHTVFSNFAPSFPAWSSVYEGGNYKKKCSVAFKCSNKPLLLYTVSTRHTAGKHYGILSLWLKQQGGA